MSLPRSEVQRCLGLLEYATMGDDSFKGREVHEVILTLRGNLSAKEAGGDAK